MEPEIPPVSKSTNHIPSEPAFAHRSRSVRNIILGSAAVLIFIILSCIAAYFLVKPVQARVDEAFIVMKMPSDLKGVLFLMKSATSNANVFGHIAYLSVTPTNSQAIQPPSSSFSPNGTLHTYTETTVGSTTSRIPRAATVTTSQWRVYVADTSGKATLIASGYAPAFLDDTHLMYFAPGGIAIHDLQTNDTILLNRLAASSTIGSIVRYSPDRTLVLWTDVSGYQSVLARVSTNSYEVIHSFGGLASPILTNTYIYDVRGSSDGSDLWRYALDGSAVTKILTFPAALNVRTFYQ